MEEPDAYLPAADSTLSSDVLDRIDDLIATAVTVNPDDNSHGASEPGAWRCAPGSSAAETAGSSHAQSHQPGNAPALQPATSGRARCRRTTSDGVEIID